MKKHAISVCAAFAVIFLSAVILFSPHLFGKMEANSPSSVMTTGTDGVHEKGLLPEIGNQKRAGVLISASSYASFVFPASLEAIEEEAFEGTAVESLYIHKNIREIKDRAFAGSANLRSIYLPLHSDAMVGKDAFSGISKEARLFIRDEVFPDFRAGRYFPAEKAADRHGDLSLTGINKNRKPRQEDAAGKERLAKSELMLLSVFKNRTEDSAGEHVIKKTDECFGYQIQSRPPPCAEG